MGSAIATGRVPLWDAAHTADTNDTALAVHCIKGEPRMDSRLLARYLGIQHESTVKTLTAYAADFRELGVFRFQIGKPADPMGGRPERYALLNENQSYLLLTYSRNTKRVRSLKVKLVKAFAEARHMLDLTRTDYLPTYHALHDEIHALAADSANERFVHLNINKLVNKAAGIESGQRPGLDIPRKAMVIMAQFLASQAMRGATDRREGYAHAKTALARFGVICLGGQP